MQIETLTLTPDRAKAAGWSVLSLVVIAMGAWVAIDATGEPVAGPLTWAMLGLMVAASAWFIFQLVAPNHFLVRVEPTGIRSRAGWQHLDIPWDRVESASIRLALGEPYLRLVVIEEVDGGWVTNPTAVPLPIGADVPALRMALARARAVGRVAVESGIPAV